MEAREDIEMKLWEYLDGTLPAHEREQVSVLISNDEVWTALFLELSAFHSSLGIPAGPDQPSMSFSRNVMEAVSHSKIAKPAHKYINPFIIRSIAAMFIVGLIITVIYVIVNTNWTIADHTTTATKDVIGDFFRNVSLNSYSGIFVNVFIVINILLALLLGDRLLHKRRYSES